MKEKEEREEIILPVGITEEMLSMWRAKYRKISSITVEDGGESYTGFFRRPDMSVIGTVSSVARSDEFKAAIVMFENCWLGGDDMMREDAVIKMAAMGKLQELMSVSIVTLKNW